MPYVVEMYDTVLKKLLYRKDFEKGYEARAYMEALKTFNQKGGSARRKNNIMNLHDHIGNVIYTEEYESNSQAKKAKENITLLLKAERFVLQINEYVSL